MGGGAGGQNQGEAKIKVEVTGAPEAKGLLAGVLDTIKQTGTEAKKMAEGPLKQMWTAFKEGKEAGNTFTGVLDALATSSGRVTSAITIGTMIYGAYRLAAVHAAEATVNLYKELRQLQAVAGGTMEEVDALQDVFTLMGMPSEMLTMAMFRLGAAIESDSQAIRRFGVDMHDTAGNLKEPIQVFMELRERLSGISSEAERSAAIREVFGRAGARLAPIFKADNETFKEYLEIGKKMEKMNEELAEMTMGLMKAEGKLNLEQEKFNSLLAQQAGINMKQWWADAKAGVYGFLNAMLEADKHLSERRKFGKETGVLFGGFLAGWSPEVQQAIEAQKLAEEMEKKAKVTKEEPTYTKERMKEDTEALKTQRELAAIRLKARADEAAEEQKIATGLASASTRERIAANAEAVAEENEGYDSRLGIMRKFFKGMSDETLMKQKEVQAITHAHEKKLLELEVEGNKERRKLKLEETKETEALAERALKAEARVNDLRVKQIEEREAVELDRARNASDNVVEVAEKAERAKEDAALASLDVRKRAIDTEIAMWTTLAAQYQGNAELQIKASEKITEASSKRLAAEMDTNRKIIADRASVVDAMKKQEAEKASIGGTLEDKAVASLKKQGISQITSSTVKAEASRLMAWGEYYAKQYDLGGALSDEQLAFAKEYGGVAKRLRGAGVGAGGFGVGAAISTAEQERGAQYGFRVSPEEMVYKGGAATTDVQAVMSEIPKQVKASLDEVKKMLAGTEVGGQNLANTITDMIVRKLEFEAARQ